nr:hypothetical protein [uncultured Massilia sp.]
MKSTFMSIIVGCTLSIHVDCMAQEPNVARFLAARGAHDAGYKHVAASPRPDIAPVVFIDKDGAVPSCGIIYAARQSGAQDYIELVGADPGANFPQCLNIRSMAAFKLQNRQYVAVEYLARETREDVARNFSYVYENSAGGFTLDESLTSVLPDEEGKGESAGSGETAIKLARIAALKNAFAQWQLHERDFISDKNSSFAIFEEKKSRQCHLVAEAGAAPVSAHLTDIVADARCTSALASTRLERAGTTYYLAMFKSDDGKYLVTVTSVDKDGKIASEKRLSETINKSGATRDIRGAKAALAAILH